jgi:hypothetical protein
MPGDPQFAIDTVTAVAVVSILTAMIAMGLRPRHAATGTRRFSFTRWVYCGATLVTTRRGIRLTDRAKEAPRRHADELPCNFSASSRG